MARTTDYEWNWCMDWCRERRLAPAQYKNWDKAIIAYQNHIRQRPQKPSDNPTSFRMLENHNQIKQGYNAMNEKKVYFFDKDGKYQTLMTSGEYVDYVEIPEIRIVDYNSRDSAMHPYPMVDHKLKRAKIMTFEKFVNVSKNLTQSEGFTLERLEEILSKGFKYAEPVRVREHESGKFSDVYEMQLNIAIDVDNPLHDVVETLNKRAKEADGWQSKYLEEMRTKILLEKKLSKQATDIYHLKGRNNKLKLQLEKPDKSIVYKVIKNWIKNLLKSK